jgi:hypothetical protein
MKEKNEPIIDLDDLRKTVDAFGRLKCAQLLGWPYGTLSNKLLGYMAMTEEERVTVHGCVVMHSKDAA